VGWADRHRWRDQHDSEHSNARVSTKFHEAPLTVAPATNPACFFLPIGSPGSGQLASQEDSGNKAALLR
jgi:hypothetical protein